MKYAAYAQYDMVDYDCNEIISVHKSYDLARKACRRVGDDFTAIAEVVDGAKKGDDLTRVRG